MQNTFKHMVHQMEMDIERCDIETKTKLETIINLLQRHTHRSNQTVYSCGDTYHQQQITPTRCRMLQYAEVDDISVRDIFIHASVPNAGILAIKQCSGKCILLKQFWYLWLLGES